VSFPKLKIIESELEEQLVSKRKDINKENNKIIQMAEKVANENKGKPVKYLSDSDSKKSFNCFIDYQLPIKVYN